MKITKVDALGVSIGDSWIKYDNPSFPKGPLYTEDEIQKKVEQALQRQKSVTIEKYLELKKVIKQIQEIVGQ